MFERYTERARRVVFFARYEASQFGSMTIETEHLLLGLTREDRNMFQRFSSGFDAASADSIRDEVVKRIQTREKIAVSIDLPLSDECKRILAYAAEEAERLNHRHIGTEHLLLAILREERCTAARILHERGLKLEAIREGLARTSHEASHDLRPGHVQLFNNPALPKGGIVPDADTALRIAEAVWTPLYGAESVKRQMPLAAELRFNIWIVTGSEAVERSEGLFAFILQADGRILSIGRGPGVTSSG